MSVRIRIRRSALASVPTYQTSGAAGADLTAALEHAVMLAPGERRLIPTGIEIELPPGHEAQVRPRSGLALRKGITVLNSPGTIDADYRGEIGVMLVNLGSEPEEIEPGARIAQLVIAPVVRATFVDADELSTTKRGEGGYGSTGA